MDMFSRILLEVLINIIIQIIEKSVFAGVERNTLSFSDIKNLANGGKITRNIDNRFIKSLSNLSININSTKVTITQK
jgi:hypothetical protein